MKETTKISCTDVYFNRYLQGEERETVEHKLKILKRELKHIIEKLTDWKDFVFADPLLPFGTIREATHIAHICKSHEPTLRPKFAKECNLELYR
ncbi:MAG: hypothetical protein GXO79_06665 [Chlorobi bacterium]|nr:hypothetical protein [Chlorobiota bacterium]